MATSRSGSKQTLTIDSAPVHGVGTGFTGVTFTAAASTYDTVSGGLSTSHDAGHQVNGGSFSCDVTDELIRVLAFKTGQRVAMAWSDGVNSHNFNAILEVGVNYQPRAQAIFEVTFYVDGEVS